ncbi:MAG: CoA ester lyase [Alphaproteobacteria bacterium]|nr:CoA ester lyase [Alphaproteobacteria bacterium]
MSSSHTGPFRTLLFAPGNHPRRVEKALCLKADAVILDLEDAVAIAEKVATRAIVVDALQSERSGLGYVRVNAYDTDFCFGDLLVVVAKGVDGIVLPKVETSAQLRSVDWVVSQLEREKRLPAGGIDIIPIIETGKGVANVHDIASAGTRIKRLSFGAGDYTKDMAMRWTRHEGELAHARSEIAVASRAAGLEAPLDTVWIHIKETDGCIKSAELVCDMGYQGKLCIHPDQVDPVNAVFTPSDDDVDFAEKVVKAFEEAEAQGLASIQVDGYFVDYPIVDQAQRTLDLIEKIRAKV